MTDPIKLAHEALRQARTSHYQTDNIHRGKTWGKTAQKIDAALDALAALDAIPEREPVAYRYSFDGHGWLYIDGGSGSDWIARAKEYPDAQALYE